jgi:hypothetical protein
VKTPAGNECKYFYGNYFRGRKNEECRLIGDAAPPHNWTPDLCKTCPVPHILLANACPNMILKPDISGKLLKFKRRVKITAYCTKVNRAVSEPEIGCGECHPLPPVFTEKES